MRSLIYLYNTALARLGGEQLPLNISPIESDAVGAICQNIFPHVLELTLEAHAWSFAKKRAVLALLPNNADDADDDPENKSFAYRYKKPADCILPVRILGRNALLRSENGFPAFELEGGSILCNLEQAELLYIFRAADPQTWPAYFADALVWRMAAALAPARNNDKRQQEMCEQMAEAALARACAKDRAAANPYRQASFWQMARGNSLKGV